MTYQPQPGELGHLTVRARYSPAHPGSTDCYEVEAVHVDNDGETTWLAVDEWMGHYSRGIVSFVPLPLPSEAGSMILARIRSTGVPVVLVLAASPGRPAWIVADPVEVREVAADLINPGWVQIDPATLLPIGVRS